MEWKHFESWSMVFGLFAMDKFPAPDKTFEVTEKVSFFFYKKMESFIDNVQYQTVVDSFIWKRLYTKPLIQMKLS